MREQIPNSREIKQKHIETLKKKSARYYKEMIIFCFYTPGGFTK
jgi:hypothetical protein